MNDNINKIQKILQNKVGYQGSSADLMKYLETPENKEKLVKVLNTKVGYKGTVDDFNSYVGIQVPKVEGIQTVSAPSVTVGAPEVNVMSPLASNMPTTPKVDWAAQEEGSITKPIAGELEREQPVNFEGMTPDPKNDPDYSVTNQSGKFVYTFDKEKSDRRKEKDAVLTLIDEQMKESNKRLEASMAAVKKYNEENPYNAWENYYGNHSGAIFAKHEVEKLKITGGEPQGDIYATQAILKDAEQTFKAPKKGENWAKSFGIGGAETVTDPDAWLFGILSLNEVQQSMHVFEKVEKGEPLNATESALMDAMLTRTQAEAMRSGDTSNWYKGGKIAGEALPFMRDMAMTGGLNVITTAAGKGSVKLAQRATAKYLRKKAEKQLLKEGIDITEDILSRRAADLFMRTAKVADYSGRLAADLTITPALKTPLQPTAYAEMGRNMQGQVVGNEFGTYQIEKGDDIGVAAAKTFMSRQSEGVGTYFNPALKGLKFVGGKLIPKAISNTKLGQFGGKMVDFIIQDNSILQKAGVSGYFGENLEEVYESAANYVLGLSTKEELKSFYTSDNLKSMFIGIAPMSALGMVGNAINYGSNEVEYRRAKKELGGITDELDNSSVGELGDKMLEVLTRNNAFDEKGNLTKEGNVLNQNMLSYAQRKMAKDIANDGKQENPNSKYYDFLLNDRSKKWLESYLADNDLTAPMYFNLAYKATLHENELTDYERKTLSELDRAFNGYLKAEDAAQQASAEIDTQVNPTNNKIQNVMVGGQPHMVKGGNIVMTENEEGKAILDKENSDQVITVVNAEGIPSQIGIEQLESVVGEVDAEEAKNAAIESAHTTAYNETFYPVGSIVYRKDAQGQFSAIKETGADGFIINSVTEGGEGVPTLIENTNSENFGVISLKAGDKYTLNDGTQLDIISNEDGVISASVNGQPSEQTTADELATLFESTGIDLTQFEPSEEANEVPETLDSSQENNTEAKKADIERRRREEILNRKGNTISQSEVQKRFIEKRDSDKVQEKLREGLNHTNGSINPKKRWIDKDDTIFDELIALGVKPDSRGVIDGAAINKAFTENESKLKKEVNEEIKQEGLKRVTDEFRKQDDLQKFKEINAKYDAEIAALETQITPQQEQQAQQPVETQQVEETEAPEVYPTDKKGEPIFEQMPVEQSIKVVREVLGDDAVNFVEDKLKAANKAVKAVAKKAPKSTSLLGRKAEVEAIALEKQKATESLDYWTNVKRLMSEEAIQATREQTPINQVVEKPNQVGQVIIDRYESAKKVIGNSATITAPNGKVLKGRYVLVSAYAVTPSHNPFDNYNTSEGFPLNADGSNTNQRDYKNDKANQVVTEGIANSFGGQALESVPKVSKDGVVFDGNGRTIASQLAAANNTDKAYLEALNNNAANYGFTAADLKSISNPRIVFELETELPYTTEAFAMFNSEEKKSESATASAVAKSKQLSPSSVAKIAALVDSYSSLESFFSSETATAEMVKTLVDAKVINTLEIAKLIDNGLFSATGRELITNVLLGATLNEQAIRQIGNDSSLKGIIVRAMKQILENAKLKEYSLFEDINNAIGLLYEARKAKMSVSDFLLQTNMFESGASERFSDFEQWLALAMSDRGVLFKGTMDKYNTVAAPLVGGQVDMFTGSILDPNEVKQQIIEYYGKTKSSINPNAGVDGRNRGSETTGTGSGRISLESAQAKFDAATTVEEKHKAALEITLILDEQNNTTTIVAKDNEEFISMLPTKWEQQIREERVAGVFFKGQVIINAEKVDTGGELTLTYEHEWAHNANRNVHSSEELEELWNNSTDKKILPRVYLGFDDNVKGDELIAHIIEDIIQKQGYENYKNGNIDLSLYSQQEQLKKTIDYANKQYLRNARGGNSRGNLYEDKNARKADENLQQTDEGRQTPRFRRKDQGELTEVERNVQGDVPQGGSRVRQAVTTETLLIDGVERPTRNSNGAYIHSTEEGIRNFYAWFGNSKVLDEQGRPLVVYHETDNQDKIMQGGFKYGFEKASKHDLETPYGFFFKTNDNKIGLGNIQIPVYLKMEKPFYVKDREGMRWILNIESGEYKNITESIESTNSEYGKKVNDLEKKASLIYKQWFSDKENKSLTEQKNQVNNELESLIDEWGSIIDDLSVQGKAILDKHIKSENYDGVLMRNDKGSWGREVSTKIVFSPNQIKSATNNNGEFDQNNADIRFAILGERGATTLDKAEEATTRLDNLGIAKDMDKGNKTPQEIRLATGWEKGVDGKWRYEILDGEINEKHYAELIERKFNEDIKSGLINATSLGEFYDSNELYKAYPELENIQVILYEDENQSASASYNPTEKAIYIYNPLSLESIEGRDNNIIHEIQHAIQAIEGFARGGSANDIGLRNKLSEAGVTTISELQEKIKTLKKEYGKIYQEWYNKAFFSGRYKGQKTETSNLLREWQKIEADIKKLEDNTYDFQKAFKEYQRLAGEVEARNASTRMNFTPEQRLSTLLSETADVAIEDQIVLMEGMGVMNLENIPVVPFKYGEGGTKGVFKGEDGKLYKSLQPGVHVWKDGKAVREYMGRDTQEYEILKMLEGDKRFPKVGERVETSEGAAFEIEELKDISNLTLEEFEQVEKTIKELNSKGIYSNDWISVMRRPGTNEVVINDFSSGVYDTERIGNSYYDDTLFYRLEELMSKEDRKKLEDKRAQEQFDFFGETDSPVDDIRFKIEANKIDSEYFAAIERGDMDEAQRIVDQQAVKKGYISNTDYRMMHQAPNREDYRASELMDNDVVPSDYWTHPQYYQYERDEFSSFYKIKAAIERAKKGKTSRVLMYRAVPKNIKDDNFRNGDWITPSRKYAQSEGLGITEGYRIIAQLVDLNDLWWDANSINEFGFDDGKEYAYKNTKNNRKLTDVITRDYDGDIIPPSKRFNNREYDPRFSIKSPIGFYSTVENALDKIQQEKGTKEQFKKMLLNNGAKQAEMDWMGFDELPEKLTKSDIQNWIDENRIEVEEVVKGTFNPRAVTKNDVKSVRFKQFGSGSYVVSWNDPEIGDIEISTSEAIDEDEAIDAAIERANYDNTEYRLAKPKFSQYVLPGGENYRELLLTMPKDKGLLWKQNKAGLWAYFVGDKQVSDGVPDNTYKEIARKTINSRDVLESQNADFKSAHFDEPNILAHIRFNERRVGGDTHNPNYGKRVLFIEEIQSDWAQKGKKKGFKSNKPTYIFTQENTSVEKLDNSYALKDNERGLFQADASFIEVEGMSPNIIHDKLLVRANHYQERSDNDGKAPDMPFKKTDQWVNLAARRMMRYAAEDGFDRIAWANGTQQAERYDLSKQIDHIAYKQKGIAASDNAPMYEIQVFDKSKNEVLSSSYRAEELEGVVGKEVAQKIVNGEGNAPLPGKDLPTYLTGLDLKVGGEGMKAFYDAIVPSAMNKLGKPFGAKVETIEIPETGTQQSIPVTDSMKETVMEGIPLFSIKAPKFEPGASLKEMVTTSNMFIAARADKYGAKGRRMVESEIKTVGRAISEQTANLKESANLVTGMVKALLNNGSMNHMTRAELSQILTNVRNASNKKDLTKEFDKISSIVRQIQLRNAKRRFNDLMKFKVQDKNAKGISIASTVDDETVSIITTIRKSLKELTLEDVENQINEINNLDKKTTSDETKLVGLGIARDYMNEIKTREAQLSELSEELSKAKDDLVGKKGEERVPNKELVDSIENMVGQVKSEMTSAYDDLSARLNKIIAEGKEALKNIKLQDKERVATLSHFVNSDMKGIEPKNNPEKGRTFKQWLKSNLITSPLQSFDFMLRSLAPNQVAGNGYLHDRFSRGILSASQNAYEGTESAFKMIDEAVAKIFGNKFTFRYISARDFKKMSKYELTYGTEKSSTTITATNGQLAYIYAVNKMTDGAMKLRAMGISEEQVEEMKAALPVRIVKLVDAIQDEILPKLRVKYNNAHLEIFNTSMASIENYFPLHIDKTALSQKVDLEEESNKLSGLIKNSTKSIIKRTVNTKPIDIRNSDFSDILTDHIKDMEQWAAFASIRRDMNTLLSNRNFLNRLIELGGFEYMVQFKRAAAIAVDVYQPFSDSYDTVITGVARSFATSKVMINTYTAFKQVLAVVAYLTEPSPKFQGKVLVNLVKGHASFKWAKDNLPDFRKRWVSSALGDEKLSRQFANIATEGDFLKFMDASQKVVRKYGMYPNKLIDSYMCAVGAKSIYETNYDKYISMGATEEKARERALVDAVNLYNTTQQSAESMFVSSVQLDRTFLSTAYTVFNNASLAYNRQVFDAARSLKNAFNNRANLIENRTKFNMRTFNVSEEAAKKASTKEVDTQIMRDVLRLAVFGYGVQLVWRLGDSFIYLLFGDDDDKKKKMVKEAATGGALITPIRGLFFGATFESVIDGLMDWLDTGNSYAFVNRLTGNIHPVISDVDQLARAVVSKNMNLAKAGYLLLNLGTKLGWGMDLKPFANVTYGFVELMDSDELTANDVLIDIMSMLSVPQSQLKALALDNPETFFDRYIELKELVDYGLLAPVLESNPDDLDNYINSGRRYMSREMKEKVGK